MEKQIFRGILLHEYKLGRKASETTRNINQAWGNDTAKERTVQRWFKQFDSGDFNLDDKQRTGRPSACDDDDLKASVEANPRKTVRNIATELNVSTATISRHLDAIGKVKKMDKWVPHELSEFQQARRMAVCYSLIIRNKKDPFLNRIVTCDEKWILYDNRKRSAQWLDKDESPKHMPKPNLHQKKILLSVWWSISGVIHYHFLKPGETITAERYCRELDVVHKKLCETQPSLINRKGPILLHDNARPHSAQLTVQKLNRLGYEILPHPPYSPDISPTDYHFFKHLDSFLKNKSFSNQAVVESAINEFIASRTMDFFKTGINDLVTRWQKCVDCNGAYFD